MFQKEEPCQSESRDIVANKHRSEHAIGSSITELNRSSGRWSSWSSWKYRTTCQWKQLSSFSLFLLLVTPTLVMAKALNSRNTTGQSDSLQSSQVPCGKQSGIPYNNQFSSLLDKLVTFKSRSLKNTYDGSAKVEEEDNNNSHITRIREILSSSRSANSSNDKEIAESKRRSNRTRRTLSVDCNGEHCGEDSGISESVLTQQVVNEENTDMVSGQASGSDFSSSETCSRQLAVMTIRVRGCQVREVPVYGCRGTCNSYSQINRNRFIEFQRSCRCCSPISSRRASVRLQCGVSRGRPLVRRVFLRIPRSCACRTCTDNDNL